MQTLWNQNKNCSRRISESGMSVNMAEDSNEGEDPTPSKRMRIDAGTNQIDVRVSHVGVQVPNQQSRLLRGEILLSSMCSSNSMLSDGTSLHDRNAVSATMQSSITDIRKSWHGDVTQDLRNYLVDKLVQNILPASGPTVLKDRWMANRVAYARKVEENIYESANSMDAYFQLMTNTIYKVQWQLQEKRRIMFGNSGAMPNRSENPNLGTPQIAMAEGSNSGEYPAPSKRMRMSMGTFNPNSTITEFLTNSNDYQLFQFTKFYHDRLQQAIEEGVEGLGLMLTDKDHFSGQEYHKVTELVEKGSRVDSSKLLLNLVMQKGSLARRVMWESFVKMRHRVPKLDKILKEMQENGSDLLDYMNMDYMNIVQVLPEKNNHLKDVQQKHKKALLAQTETLTVNTILIKEKVKIFQLVDRYAELTIISTVRDRTLVEHELLARGRDHDVLRKKLLRRELEKIRTDQLFQSSFSWSKSKSGSSAVVSGVPGIGKTTMVQKIVYDWATGKIYPHFQFVFSFRLRDFNTMNCRINLSNLILDHYPYFGNVLGELWKNPEGLLFIFDSLDEFKDGIDFYDNRTNEPQSMCTGPECWCEVSDIVYSLIQHKLLPGCSVLVTSRPTALHLLEKAEISVWAEILGLVGDEQKEYFNKFFDDQTVAAAVFNYVEENEIMYTMCYNPSYCWILGLSLGPFFTQTDRKQQQVPKTITQLYSYYIYNILKNHGREIESPRDVLLQLGEMAFTGVSEKKIVFGNGDLMKYNLQPSQFLSGFLMELLERDDSAQSVVYTFPHLTIQEFVAALALFLSPDPGEIRKLLNEAQSKEDGRFEILFRFIFDLSSPQAAWPLEEFLGPFLDQTTCQVIGWMKEKIEGQIENAASETGKRDLLNIFHYLFESQNKALAQATVGSVKRLAFRRLKLTPIDCAILSHVIGLCDAIKHLDLHYCYIQCEGLQWLGPVLHKCHDLRLARNNLGDSGMKLLSVALRNQDCKIQKLELNNNALTVSCAEDLASALSINRSLMYLNLGYNNLGDSGIKLLSTALRNPDSKIQELSLSNNSLTDSCAEDLVFALSTNRALTDLNLGNNNLGDLGVKLLSEALRNPDCKIQKLGLYNNALTDLCAQDLASALNTNQSLLDLNLDNNKLGDSGMKLLSAALRNPDCKIQILDLEKNGLTDSCTDDLASALSTNQSLTLLYLQSNSFTDHSISSLCRLMLTCRNLEQIELKGNWLSPDGKRHLESLRQFTPGLRVIV
ncbi:NACHT, LRR and PYD domains-containing protein 3-like isoform X1 [Scyliorhinus canicula]|uniref:NACHT, LRR and PYD domains-containing protein 3-like isoform X1 n=3 Tax=Scyliorhinus canicula TaxID=7830 RepID=UPI0018F758D4|nr:NACHT, LRR and PYD domains-containing protein 3-like isoform X1 [Scyliorhinus canicula]XP_038656760.1 NACHT, LRR and PYD domains-containing protein 3-like isoform X1 [Scyliorhinus canicula]